MVRPILKVVYGLQNRLQITRLESLWTCAQLLDRLIDKGAHVINQSRKRYQREVAVSETQCACVAAPFPWRRADLLSELILQLLTRVLRRREPSPSAQFNLVRQRLVPRLIMPFRRRLLTIPSRFFPIVDLLTGTPAGLEN